MTMPKSCACCTCGGVRDNRRWPKNSEATSLPVCRRGAIRGAPLRCEGAGNQASPRRLLFASVATVRRSSAASPSPGTHG
jgi:hypothetical protein